MVATAAILGLALVAGVWAVLTPGLMRSVIGLAAVSVLATILMFMLGAGLAAVFELSVCGGLITVVFVSTISMTQPAKTGRSPARDAAPRPWHRNLLRRYAVLPLLVLASGAAVAYFVSGLSLPPLPAALGSSDAREVLWGERRTDLLGQAIVILAGSLGVLVLFKERKR